jgi:hypothetical protein
MAKIGVLTSITFSGTALEIEFRAGLNDPTVTLDVQGPFGYDTARMNGALDAFNRDQTINLIATVGGSVTELAADARTQKPFVSIDGGAIPGVSPVPRPAPHLFRWRVDLASLADNHNRKTHLTRTFDIQPTEIGLLANPNSSQHQAEHAQGWADERSATVDDNDTAQTAAQKFNRAFAAFPNNIIAVIVSADPYFKKFGTELVGEANGWVRNGRRRVCYPLQDYADHGPEPSKTTLFGPQLITRPGSGYSGAYKVLGQKAAVALGSPTSHGTETPHVFSVDR